MSDLNPRQEKFISEYLKTLNVTQSAIKAGYSPHTASVQGSRLLKNEKVAKYIDEQRKKVIDEGVLSANELLHILSNAAVWDESEVREVVVKRGEFQRNPETDKMNLVYNEHVEMVEVPIKPSDRLRARDMLGKYHKLFTDKKELSTDTPIFINIGEWPEDEEEEKRKALDEIHEQHPNRTMIINDIPDEEAWGRNYYIDIHWWCAWRRLKNDYENSTYSILSRCFLLSFWLTKTIAQKEYKHIFINK